MKCFYSSPPPAFFPVRICMLLLLWAVGWVAQSAGQCSSNIAWALEISAAPPPPPNTITLPSGCTDAGSCGKLYYYVSLVKVGTENTSETFPFRYSSIGITGQINIVAGTSTSRQLSRLDAAASQACSPAEVNSGGVITASWGDDNKFAYSNGTPNTSGTGSDADVTWQITGRRLLFVIAVDAYPGEAVEPSIHSGSGFQLVTGTAPNTVVTTYCATVTTLGPLSKTFTPPSNYGNTPFLQFSSPLPASIPGFPNRKKISVSINGGASTYTVEKLDFLIHISTPPTMDGIHIEAGALPAANTNHILYNEGADYSKQRIHVSARNFSLSGPKVLLYIVIDGPPAASACASVELSVAGPLRIRGTRGGTTPVCCQPLIPAPLSFQVGPTPCTPLCTDNVQLQIKKVAFPTDGDACSDLFFALYVASIGNSFTYTSGTAVMDLIYDGSLEPTASFTPDPNITFSYTSALVTTQTFGSNVLRITFQYSVSSVGIVVAANSVNTPKALGTFQLKGTNVCIQSISFNDATIDQGSCVVQSYFTEVKEELGDDLCLQSLKVLFQTQYNTVQQPIEGVSFTVSNSSCNFGGITNDDGTASGYSCRVYRTRIPSPCRHRC